MLNISSHILIKKISDATNKPTFGPLIVDIMPSMQYFHFKNMT